MSATVVEAVPGYDPEALARRLADADAAIVVARGLDPGDVAGLRAKLRALGVDWTRVVVIDALRDTRAAGVGLDTLIGIWSRALTAVPRRPVVRMAGEKRVTRRALLHLGAAAVLEYTSMPEVGEGCAGLSNCRLCVDACPYGALTGKPPRPLEEACLECGLCTSLCPLDLIHYPALPPALLAALVDAAAEEGVERITVTCPQGRPEIYGDEPGLVVEAPCVAAVHPALHLYAAQKGVALAEYCPAGHGYQCRLLKAERVHDRLVALLGGALQPPGGDFTEPRRYLLSLKPRGEGWVELPAPLFFRLRVSESCTLCGVCVKACRFDALRLEEGGEYRLLFRHGACVGCGDCAARCPEGALMVEAALNPALLGAEEAVASSPAARCRSCGRVIGPEARLRRLEGRLAGRVDTGFLWLCEECRVRREFLGERGAV